MSRSYKRYPLIKSIESGKFGKKQANKKVRNTKLLDIPNGNSYRKIYETTEIREYESVEFKEWVIEKFYSKQKDKLYNVDNYTHWYSYDTLEEALLDWKRTYIRK